MSILYFESLVCREVVIKMHCQDTMDHRLCVYSIPWYRECTWDKGAKNESYYFAHCRRMLLVLFVFLLICLYDHLFHVFMVCWWIIICFLCLPVYFPLAWSSFHFLNLSGWLFTWWEAVHDFLPRSIEMCPFQDPCWHITPVNFAVPGVIIHSYGVIVWWER